MEAGTTTTNLTARLPILNPADYDLWLMRIEQYFLMTDYSLWEVIKNGNKVLKKTVGTVEHINSLYMTTKFKMSMTRQMSFFLGLQISQSPRGIFINQSKYASKVVKKYDMLTSKSVEIPMVEKSKLDEDLHGNAVDATLYHDMISSLIHLTSSRPDLIYVVCLCARMSMIAYVDADHTGCQDTRRSTSGSAQFLGASGKWNRGSIHLHQTFTKRKIQLLDRKARYEKHVSGNVETSGRGNGRVMVAKGIASISTSSSSGMISLTV
ncbi:uncharacterized mitochondrial protein-like protein [Tanacetum coccineum]